MPRGPNGEWRPADAVGCAVTVARIATGEKEERGYKQTDKREDRTAGGRSHAKTFPQEQHKVVAKGGVTERKAFMLAAMSPAGRDAYSPVQVHKLFFLLDENVVRHTRAPYFKFQPHDYGPLDMEIYGELKQLEKEGLIEMTVPGSLGIWTYRLTKDGYLIGKEAFRGLEEPIQDYIEKIVHFIRSLSLVELMSFIYQMYPEMTKNCVFPQGVR